MQAIPNFDRSSLKTYRTVIAATTATPDYKCNNSKINGVQLENNGADFGEFAPASSQNNAKFL
jgi:hypothetical protein